MVSVVFSGLVGFAAGVVLFAALAGRAYDKGKTDGYEHGYMDGYEDGQGNTPRA